METVSLPQTIRKLENPSYYYTLLTTTQPTRYIAINKGDYTLPTQMHATVAKLDYEAK